MLADKNSFEYKKKKYGWTREQFNEYNKSRAQSKNNMVTRYGIEEGTKRWSEYVETQRYAGSSLEWFILKHGEEVGLQLWDEINKKKAIGGNNMQVSRIEQAFVDLLIQIPELDDADVMYGEGSQYMVSVSGRYYLYDFVVLKPYKLCIEFHGDYWHCNPVKYAPDFIHSHLQLSAQEIWDKNLQKQLVIEAQGFRYHVVWENDWRTDKVSCLEVITNIIDELSGN
jgi:G:T-mismatch repair DNA endonuclease (very short patch repair protein)